MATSNVVLLFLLIFDINLCLCQNYNQNQTSFHDSGLQKISGDPMRIFQGRYSHEPVTDMRRLGPRKNAAGTSTSLKEIIRLTGLDRRREDSPMTMMNDPQSQTFQDPDYALSVPLTPRENSKIRQLKKNLESLPNPNPNTGPKKKEILGVRCDFERACHWTWNSSVEDGFKVVSSADMVALNRTSKYKLSWPSADASDNVTGHYLHLSLLPTTGLRIVRSPVFKGTRDSCKLDMYLHQNNMFESSIKVIMVKINNQNNSVVAGEIRGDNYNSWIRRSFILGRNTQEFYVELEIVPNNVFSEGVTAAHLSLDRLRLVDCFPEGAWNTICTATQIRCEANQVPVCINASRICDITKDCDGNEDEMQDCDKIPFGGRCSFETGWCGWTNGDGLLKWSRHQGSTPTANTGPESDHTHQSKTGFYMYVNMDQRKDAEFTSNAALDSVTFNPPPRVHGDPSSKYYNSCTIRFYYHKYGKNPGSIRLILLELKARDNTNRDQLWFTSRDEGRDWVRAEVILPNVTHRYVLQFEARKGMRIYGDVAIDDFSLSPECFGLNIPAADLNGYNYWDPQIESSNKEPHADFVNRTLYEFTTCHASGRFGPKPEDCIVAYNNTPASGVAVATREPYAGMQLWTVPNEGHYTIIAKGAGGGQGSDGVGSSRGATARAVLELHKQEQIYLLVGQQGLHACVKTLSGKVDPTCEYSRSTASELYHSKTQQVKNTRIQDGGGGGGGGTFVFLINNNGKAIPLIIAAGGGGLGVGRFLDDSHQHGHEYNASRAPHSGDMYGKPNETAGAGGGWRPYMGPITAGFGQVMGTAVLYGGTGGAPCYPAKGGNGQGGFGGGGGGCTKGGGGGGFSGGDTSLNSTNGGGGFSYITPSRTLEVFSEITPGSHSGSGQVFIIPAISGCGCDYRCIALDEFMSDVRCICPDRWKIGNDNTSCIPENENIYVYLLILALIFITIVLVVALGALLLVPYNRYQRRKQEALRQRAILEQDLTLNRLRSTTDESALTNFNPNYGCDGLINGNVDVKSLPQVARESLRLVKALGQGAFGEVFQGLYRHRDGDAVEMPVAVKTLPDMSTGQSESDFLMEAAIMAKFSHPNIVHLIGVCFDRHPRFIVLELLAGGDLKNFLREGRNKPILTMKDLMFCALDVAKGCRYMEGKRFIHRDIAARNCLLTSKGPGRVVKIADFGMARDIYRSDYYRKGGKAMLPIKWMPPEAFLDGIFTSKTDVWSFGVLLWEVFSLGIMPYTGLANRDVMQLVTGGGRLDIPPGCPTPLYRVMCECWCPTPENRPSFSQLFERITVCTQDPEIMNAPLPSFTRLPSSERDATIMRPPGNDNSCLEVPNSSDYLIPLPGPAPPQSTSTDRLLDTVDTPVLTDVTWETRFMLSSNQHNKPTAERVVAAPPGPLVEKLISIDTPQQTPTNTQAPINIEQTIAVAMVTKMSNYSGNMAASQNGDPPNDPKLLTNSLTNGIMTDKQLTDKLNHNQSIPMTHLSLSQNNTKHASTPDKSLVLNVSQLDIQNTFINKPYANVTMNDNDASLKKNGPYTIQNQGLKSAPYLNNDSEISC